MHTLSQEEEDEVWSVVGGGTGQEEAVPSVMNDVYIWRESVPISKREILNYLFRLLEERKHGLISLLYQYHGEG